MASGAPVELLHVADDRDCVWAQYTIKVENRPAVIEALKAQGIPTAVHYPRPLHRQPAYERTDCPVACMPHANAAAEHVMSLPMSADLSEAAQQTVADALAAVLANA